MMRWMIAGLIAAAVAGCKAHEAKPTRAEDANVSAAGMHDGRPLIVQIVSRRETVIVTAGPREPLYSVRSTDGRELVANATLEELRTKHPEIYRRVEPSLAVDASVNGPGPRKMGGVMIDASDARR